MAGGGRGGWRWRAGMGGLHACTRKTRVVYPSHFIGVQYMLYMYST